MHPFEQALLDLTIGADVYENRLQQLDNLRKSCLQVKSSNLILCEHFDQACPCLFCAYAMEWRYNALLAKCVSLLQERNFKWHALQVGKSLAGKANKGVTVAEVHKTLEEGFQALEALYERGSGAVESVKFIAITLRKLPTVDIGTPTVRSLHAARLLLTSVSLKVKGAIKLLHIWQWDDSILFFLSSYRSLKGELQVCIWKQHSDMHCLSFYGTLLASRLLGHAFIKKILANNVVFLGADCFGRSSKCRQVFLGAAALFRLARDLQLPLHNKDSQDGALLCRWQKASSEKTLQLYSVGRKILSASPYVHANMSTWHTCIERIRISESLCIRIGCSWKMLWRIKFLLFCRLQTLLDSSIERMMTETKWSFWLWLASNICPLLLSLWWTLQARLSAVCTSHKDALQSLQQVLALLAASCGAYQIQRKILNMPQAELFFCISQSEM